MKNDPAYVTWRRPNVWLLFVPQIRRIIYAEKTMFIPTLKEMVYKELKPFLPSFITIEMLFVLDSKNNAIESLKNEEPFYIRWPEMTF